MSIKWYVSFSSPNVNLESIFAAILAEIGMENEFADIFNCSSQMSPCYFYGIRVYFNFACFSKIPGHEQVTIFL